MKGMGPSLLLEEDKTGNKVLFQFDVILQTVDNFIELNTCNCFSVPQYNLRLQLSLTVVLKHLGTPAIYSSYRKCH